MTLFVPIGADCGVAFFCRKFKMRHFALPFDWTVSYNGVSHSIEDDLTCFTDPLDLQRISNYGIYFHHDFSQEVKRSEDEGKYARRCARLLRILETTTECVVFCRKGHSSHHHDEHNGRYQTIVSDLDDCKRLHGVISVKYPTLRFKIVVFLLCGKCFSPHVLYESPHANIEIYNIAIPGASNHHDDYARFEDCARRCPSLQPSRLSIESTDEKSEASSLPRETDSMASRSRVAIE